MLSKETESKIIELLMGIAKGDIEIGKIKQSLVNSNLVNPFQIFMRLDANGKGKINDEDIRMFLNQYNIPCSPSEAKFVIFFYDKNFNGQLEYFEFLNLLIDDADYLIKKAAKKQYGKLYEEIEIPSELEMGIVDLFKKEIEFSIYVSELISEVKQCHDFVLQDLFFIIKSYSFITYESIKAFFDRKGVNYTPEDIKAIFNRIDNNKDGKISFNDLKSLFNMAIEVNSFKGSIISEKYNEYNDNIDDDGDTQYECIHLSRSNSPKIKSTGPNTFPIIKPLITDGRNNQYRSFMRQARETSLSRSKSRSLSRSSEFQSPGVKEEYSHSFSGNNIYIYEKNSINNNNDNNDNNYNNYNNINIINSNNIRTLTYETLSKENDNNIKNNNYKSDYKNHNQKRLNRKIVLRKNCGRKNANSIFNQN